MSKKIKDTDYLFITTLIRARESRLLTRDRIERMIEAKSSDEAAKILEECGYENITGAAASVIDAKISAKRANVMKELSTLVPDKILIDVFRLKYDYHNAKVLIKSEATNTNGFRLMSDSGRFSTEILTDAFYKNEIEPLSKIFAEALSDAKDTLARTGDPQLSDFVLDKAYFQEFSEFANKAGSRFLAGYCRLMIDSANLRTTVRSLRMGKDSVFLQKVLISGGNIKSESITSFVMQNKPLSELFSDSLLASAAIVGDIAAKGGKLTEFEKLCDNALIAYLSKSKAVSFGDAVLIAYIAAIENECLAARIIMTGKLAGLSPEVIRERLRDSYV